MSYTGWTDDPLASSDTIKAVHITELRDNVDWLDANCPCVTEFTADNNPVNVSEDSGDHGTDCSNLHSTYEGTNNGEDDGTDYGSDNGAENTSENGTNNVGDDASNNVSALYAEFGSNNGPDHADYNSGFEGAAVVDEHGTYCSGEEVGYNSIN